MPLALGLITLIGLVLRLHLYGRSLLGDELSTLWIVQNHNLLDTVRVVGTNAEITPPLSFILSWFTTRLGDAPELVRLPSLIAGTATIPLVYLLGRKAVGTGAGLVGAAVFALSPFTTYFAANGRGYAVMLLLLAGSTLVMLRGIETSKPVWWVVYGALSALAMYSHYTAAFVLLAQLGWLFVLYPESRIAALVANGFAALLYLPWIPKVMTDFDSPTTDVMEALQGSGLESKLESLVQWVFGHQLFDISVFPGTAILLVTAAGVLLALGFVIFSRRARSGIEAAPLRGGFVLLVTIAVATPLAEALLLVIGTDLFGSRNMTASWYGLAPLIGALVVLPGGVVTLVSGALVLGGFGASAVKLWGDSGNLVAAKEVAGAIDEEAGPGDVVVDSFVASDTPTPLTPLKAHMNNDLPYFALGMPEGPPPFLPFVTQITPPSEKLDQAFGEARGVIFLRVPTGVAVVEGKPGKPVSQDNYLAERRLVLPAGAKIESEESFPAFKGSDLYVIDPGED